VSTVLRYLAERRLNRRVWKRARLSVWKQNRSTAKKGSLDLLTAVIHKNTRNVAGINEKVVHWLKT